LEEPTTPRSIPLVIPKIKIGIKVTLINSITHASEVFSTIDIILKDTLVTEISESQLVFLAELVDDLVVGVKHVVLVD
jgi:hypothetical protein